MSATSSDSATAAAPQQPSLHVPMVFRHGSTQIEEAENEHNYTPGPGTPSSGGGGGTTLSDAAQSLRFSAECKQSDGVGNAVRMNGRPNLITSVTNADPYPVVGIIVSKSSTTQCVVQTYGMVSKAVTGLRPMQRYFVGPNSALITSTQAYNAGRYVQLVGFAVGADTLFVQPSGTILQLAAARAADGEDATPEPSGTGQGLLYGGVLYGTEAPAADYGRKGDSYFRYQASGGVALYGPKSEAGWGEAKSLQGEPGNRIYIRDTAPDGTETPNAGDLWLDTVAYNLYPAE